VVPGDSENFQEQLSYFDAMNLMNAHPARRQSAMYATGLALTPANPQLLPFQVGVRAAYADFFAMFDVPFRYGAPWSADDDAARSDVVVITGELNDRVFGGANSVGKVLNLDNHDYRVVGVRDKWQPIPKFYDLNNEKYGKGEDLYLPFTKAIDAHMESWGNRNCAGDFKPGWEGHMHSECIWIQFWAELPTAADAAHYRSFLNNYAAEQQRTGRFSWPPHTRLSDVQEWLVHQHAVSDEVRILVLEPGLLPLHQYPIRNVDEHRACVIAASGRPGPPLDPHRLAVVLAT